MAEIKPSFRTSNKADSDQWPATAHDDDLFDQYIDSDPLDFSSSENTADASEFSLLFEVPRSPGRNGDPSKPLSGVDLEAAPKLQAPSVPLHAQDHRSPRLLSSSSPHQSAQNAPDPVIDAFALSLLPSRPTLAAAASKQHLRISSDSSHESLHPPGGNVDSAGLPQRDRIASVSPTMAQPTISRQTTQDAWAQRLEQRAENYHFSSSHGTPLTPPPSGARQSPATKQSGGSTPYHPANNANYNHSAANGHVTPYHRNSQTPVTPSFNDFSMDSVITSPHVDRPQNWEDNPISPFDFQYDPSSPHQHAPQHAQQQQMQSFDESRVQPWWPPTTSGAQHQPDQRSYRQTSAPAVPQSQPQYSTYYSNHVPATHQMSAQGIMINCQPGTNEIAGPTSMTSSAGMSASSAPSMQSYPRNSSFSHSQQVRRMPSHPNTQSHPPTVPSSTSSRRASKSQSSSHRRSKSSASPPFQGAKDNSQNGAVGFVNFTPNDSKRILTGVAPSGSSKTKARREKEAADRRRRLNEAAQRAVMEAGGDVTALERSGLFAA